MVARANLRQAEFRRLDHQKVDLSRQLLTQDAVGGMALQRQKFLRLGAAVPLFGAAAPLSAGLAPQFPGCTISSFELRFASFSLRYDCIIFNFNSNIKTHL